MLTAKSFTHHRRMLRGLAVATLALAASAGLSWGGPGGTGQLTLREAALAELVAPATQRSVPFRLQGVGEVRLHIGRAEEVRLLDGAVRARVPVKVAPLGLAGALEVELVPEIDRKSGRLSLRARRAQASGALSSLPDLSRALPSVELPRALEQVVSAGDGEPFRLSVYVQGVDVDPERVLIEFLVKTGAAAGQKAPEREKGAR